MTDRRDEWEPKRPDGADSHAIGCIVSVGMLVLVFFFIVGICSRV